MRPIADYLYIGFDKLFEDQTESGLFIDTEDYVSEQDPDRAKQQHRRIWGTVIEVPLMLDPNTKLTLKEPGIPWPKRSITGEFIAEQIARNPRGGFSAADYSAAGFEPEFVTLADYEMLAKKGDKVYVHHDAFDKPLAEKIFLIRYDSVICVVRDGLRIMCGDHNLIRPKLIDGMDIYSQAGLLLMLGDNKHPLRGYTESGQEIAFMPNADWVNRIEGEDFYVVKKDDIMLEITTQGLKPRGNRVIVEFDKAAAETDGGLMVPTMTQLKEKASSGRIIAVNEGYGLSVGQEVLFPKGAGVVFDDEYLVIRETDIFATR